MHKKLLCLLFACCLLLTAAPVEAAAGSGNFDWYNFIEKVLAPQMGYASLGSETKTVSPGGESVNFTPRNGISGADVLDFTGDGYEDLILYSLSDSALWACLYTRDGQGSVTNGTPVRLFSYADLTDDYYLSNICYLSSNIGVMEFGGAAYLYVESFRNDGLIADGSSLSRSYRWYTFNSANGAGLIPRWTIEDRGDRETGVGLYFRSYTSAAKYTEELLAWTPPPWRGPEAGDPTPVVDGGNYYAFRKIGIPEAVWRDSERKHTEQVPGTNYLVDSFRGTALLKTSLRFTATGETSLDAGSFTGLKATYTISFKAAEDAKLPRAHYTAANSFDWYAYIDEVLAPQMGYASLKDASAHLEGNYLSTVLYETWDKRSGIAAADVQDLTGDGAEDLILYYFDPWEGYGLRAKLFTSSARGVVTAGPSLPLVENNSGLQIVCASVGITELGGVPCLYSEEMVNGGLVSDGAIAYYTWYSFDGRVFLPYRQLVLSGYPNSGGGWVTKYDGQGNVTDEELLLTDRPAAFDPDTTWDNTAKLGFQKITGRSDISFCDPFVTQFPTCWGTELLKETLRYTCTGRRDMSSYDVDRLDMESTVTVAEDAKLPKTPSIGVLVDGRAVSWPDAKPFVDANSRTMVPLRAVADALGLEVNWDGAARTASFSRSGRTIYFTIGGSVAYTTEGTVPMDTAAVIVDSRTYAPVRYLAEYFGHTVDWDGTTGTVIIK